MGEAGYWSTGRRIIEQAAARIRDAQQPIAHVSVFAIARIPFLVALGFDLDNKIPVTIHQRRRDGTGDGGWLPDSDARAITFGAQRLSGAPGSSRVALAVSLTASIGEAVTATIDADATVHEIAPVGVECDRDVLGARASIENFAETYHCFLEMVEREHPNCSQIEIFSACPASAAVALGRGVMRDTQPALLVYDRATDGSFKRTFELR